jgi:hypothetical protein
VPADDLDVVGAEARHCQCDAVLVLGYLLNVVWGKTCLVALQRMCEQGGQLVEADARPLEGSEIKCRHSYPPLRSDNHG